MRRKIGVLISISVLVLGFILGTAAQGQETVKLEYFMLANKAEKEAWDKVIEMFEKEHPNIDIDGTWVPADQYYDKLKVRVASGSAPDLSRIVIEEYQGLVEKGAFLDLTPYIEQEVADNPDFKAQMDDYLPILLDAFRYEGGIYGLPGDWNDAIIFYNKDLFDAAGIPYPSADWTVEDFVEIAQKLTKDIDGDGKIDQYGYMVTGDWFDCFCPWIWTFGGQILSDDWKSSKMNEQGAIDGITFMNDLVNKYKVSPSPAAQKQYGGAQFFMTGKVAMAHYGRYMVPAFREVKFDWDVQQHPVGPGGKRGVPYGVASISASATTKHPKEAFDFVRFSSSPKVVQLFNEMGNSIPVLQSVVDQDDFKHPAEAPKNQYAMIEALEFARLIPSPPPNAEIIDIARSEIDALLATGSLSPKEVAESIHQQITEVLQEWLSK